MYLTFLGSPSLFFFLIPLNWFDTRKIIEASSGMRKVSGTFGGEVSSEDVA